MKKYSEFIAESKDNFDPNRGKSDGYPSGFDKHSVGALRRARSVGNYRHIIHNPEDFDHLYKQGHLEKHPDSPEHHGMEHEDERTGEPKYEVKLTAHARNLYNQMKS